MRRILQALALCALAACSDRSPESITFGSAATRGSALTTPTVEQQIDALYPTGLRAAAQARWASVTKLLAASQQKPARVQFFQLLDWTLKQQSKLIDPAGPPTAQDGMTQLIASMWAVVYGTSAPIPSATLTGDAVVGIVMPGSPTPTTIVTPAERAAVTIPGDAVAEPTLVTIQENLTPYPAQCSGPLLTGLCQYPLFYKYDAYPVDEFQAKVKVILCPATTGGRQPAPTVDNNLRLAHQAPTNPALVTGTVIGGVEVLPQLAAPGVVNCENVSYSGPVLARAPESLLKRGAHWLAVAADRLAGAIGPDELYAVDQGAGGELMSFSDFDWIDPNQLNLALAGPLTAAPTTAAPGGYVVTGSFSVQNALLAASPSTSVGFYLSTDNIFDGSDVALDSRAVPALAAGATTSISPDSLIVPPGTQGGMYKLLAVLDPASALGEVTRSDNVLVGPAIGVVFAAPALYSPADQSTFNYYPRTLTLSWAPVPGATGYQVETEFCGYPPYLGFTGICDTPSTPWSSYAGATNNPTTSFTFNFVGAQTGRWRVRVDNPVLGAWSPWWYFEFLQ